MLVGDLTFEQVFIINDNLKPGMDKGVFILSLFDIYEVEEDETRKSVLESLVEKLDAMPNKDFKALSKQLPLETYVE